ncbi:MAG: hypothetical protein LBH49_02435 [Puniceicoccales bacterium]|jgi:3-phytase|nr:hypothetical protein [Puniceicoccales bacterium]
MNGYGKMIGFSLLSFLTIVGNTDSYGNSHCCGDKAMDCGMIDCSIDCDKLCSYDSGCNESMNGVPYNGKVCFNVQKHGKTCYGKICYDVICYDKCQKKCQKKCKSFCGKYKNTRKCKKYEKKCKDDKIEKIVELWMTPQNHSDNLDSVACAGNRIYVTAKNDHTIQMYDARNGVPLGRFGGKGDDMGQLNRPNGVAAIDNLLFVTERDNSRIQVFSIPDYAHICTFGEDILFRPYGIFVCKVDDYYLVYITDDGKTKKSENDDARRIVTFILDEEMNQMDPLQFGIKDEFGVGEFGKLESIYGNLDNKTLLIADEKSNELKLYSFDGEYLNKKINSEFFSQGDPEGVWFFKKDGRSYWLAVEQRKKKTTIFHVFDAQTLAHVKSFSGIYTKNTDGICISEMNGRLILYAVNDDQAVTAFSLDFI